MLMDRIQGVFTFRRSVYADVEHDQSFTSTAWAIVVVVAFLNQIGTNVKGNFGNWVLASIGGTIGAVIGFAVMAFFLNWAGRQFFNAQVTFNELVRTMGLAYIWNILGVVGALVAFSPALTCILSPLFLIVGILNLVAWFFAVREALDLETMPAIGAVILAFIVYLVVLTIVSVILGTILGITIGGIALVSG